MNELDEDDEDDYEYDASSTQVDEIPFPVLRSPFSVLSFRPVTTHAASLAVNNAVFFFFFLFFSAPHGVSEMGGLSRARAGR